MAENLAAKYGGTLAEDDNLAAKYGGTRVEETAPTPAPAVAPEPEPTPRPETPFLTAVGRSVAEAVPFAPQVTGVSEKGIAEARQDWPITTAATRFGTTLGEYAGAARGGPTGVGLLSAAQEASALQREGKLDFTDPTTYAKLAAAGVFGAAGAKLLARLPKLVQNVLPVGLGASQALTAKDTSGAIEAGLNVVPMALTSGSQAVRGVNRFLSSGAERAGEQLLSSKGAELAALRQAELEKAAADVASAEARRRALTGEQQTRLANATRLEEAGGRMGFAPAPPDLLPPEAVPEAQQAYESFFRNAPEKFTSEATRVAAQQAEARAAQEAADIKWSDPLAVAASMRPVGPVTPGPVSPELMEAARLLQQRELAAARARVPEEVKEAAKSRALIGSVAGVPAYIFGQRVVPITATTAAATGTLGAGIKLRQLLATDPKTKLFKDPAAANVIYDAIPRVARKFPDAFGRYLSLATDAGIRARPAFLLEALRRDPDLARAVEEEVTGEVSPE
jgi:hypothetical protein